MRWVKNVNYEVLSQQGRIWTAHRGQLTPFCAVVFLLGKILKHCKSVSFFPQITICLFHPFDDINSTERSPYNYLANFANKTTPDVTLSDRYDTSISFPVEKSWSAWVFGKTQHLPTTLTDQTSFNPNDTIPPTASKLDATFSQISTFFQSERLTVSDAKLWKTNVPTYHSLLTNFGLDENN